MVFASINSHSEKIASAIKRNTRFSHHQRRKIICRFIRTTPKRRQKILTAFSCRAASCVRADPPEDSRRLRFATPAARLRAGPRSNRAVAPGIGHQWLLEIIPD